MNQPCMVSDVDVTEHTLIWPAEEPRLQVLCRHTVAWLLSKAIVPAAAYCQHSYRPGILMYHRIARSVPGLPQPSINVPPERFEQQLSGLLARGYRFWPLRRLLDAQASGEPVPKQVVVVTFDDGFENLWTEAVPILSRLGIPATIFLATAYLGQQGPFPFDYWGRRYYCKAPAETYRPLSWEQCQKGLACSLIEWGAHTHTHQDFRGRAEVFRQDLQQCLQLLEARLGIHQPTFAFPYGAPYLGFVDDRLLEVARQLHVRCALTTETGLVDLGASPFGWPRLHVFAWDTAATLDAKLRGCYAWLPCLAHQLKLLRQRSNRKQPATAKTGSILAGILPPLAPTRAENKAAKQARLNPLAFSPPATEPAGSNTSRTATPSGLPLPYLSIVVPTYNRCSWLKEAIASLSAQETCGLFDYEIIIVDNASSDGTARVVGEMAAEAPERIRYVYESRPGDAPARNAGIRQAKGTWIAFFDDDQIADPNWLIELYRVARQTCAGVVGGPVHLWLDEHQANWCGAQLRRLMRETVLYTTTRPYRVRHLPGTGNALVHRSLFEQLGGFDEAFQDGGSDVDFFERGRKAGFALWYTPKAIIRHRVPPDRLSPRFIRWDALSGGAGQARQVDRPRWGVALLPALALLRAAKATLWHLPLAWFYGWAGRPGWALGHWSLIWRAEGYVRQTLAFLLPRVCAQRAFFESLEFRKGRLLAPSGSDTSFGLSLSQDTSPISGAPPAYAPDTIDSNPSSVNRQP